MGKNTTDDVLLDGEKWLILLHKMMQNTRVAHSKPTHYYKWWVILVPNQVEELKIFK